MENLSDEDIVNIMTLPIRMTALQFILSMRPCVPMSRERKADGTVENNGLASNSEIRRWLDQSAVIINGKKPKSKEIIELPVTELVFFPKSEKSKTTVF